MADEDDEKEEPRSELNASTPEAWFVSVGRAFAGVIDLEFVFDDERGVKLENGSYPGFDRP